MYNGLCRRLYSIQHYCDVENVAVGQKNHWGWGKEKRASFVFQLWKENLYYVRETNFSGYAMNAVRNKKLCAAFSGLANCHGLS